MKGPPMQNPITMNLSMPQVIHQADVVVGVGVPRPIDLERAGGLAAIGVAQVGADAAELVLELRERVEGIAVVEQGGRRVQAAAGDEQQREARALFLVADADRPFLVEGRGRAAGSGLTERAAMPRPSPLPQCRFSRSCV